MVSPYAMQYLMDNLKFGDNGGAHMFHYNKSLPMFFGDRGGISSLIPPDYGDRGGCKKCVKKTPQERPPPAFGPRRPPFRPYKFTPPRPHHSIRHTLGDDGGVFNRMSSVPFHGPRRYTLN